MARSLEEWSEIELPLPQFRTVLLLSKGPKRMSEIAAHFGKGLSSATSLIDRLVDKGLVERTSDTDDRRVVLCRLATRGQDEMDRFHRMGQMRLERLVQTLSPEEVEEIIAALNLLTRMIARVSTGAGEPQATAERTRGSSLF